MKVFISWSGEVSKNLGEAIRDWLPSVIQLVKPYFTPSDIEKGNRWSSDIAKELEESQIGIICVTRDNLHADWVLFEAGALSKSLTKSHVCPILFGITDTDLSGPLKQFQATEFNKDDFHKLMSVINNRLGESKLPLKTLDSVFDKWWPELEERISQILDKIDSPQLPIRSDRDILEEILQLSRADPRISVRTQLNRGAVTDLLENYIALCDQQAGEHGNYQDALDILAKMKKVVTYIASKTSGESPKLVELQGRLETLTFSAPKRMSTIDDDIPF